ncbi:MAG: outer membrane protein transport protein [Gallionella sp.]|nr:outer membrane protein transport protein [Gallionella sp.]
MKTRVVSMFVASVTASTLAYATNGDTMMSVGAENTALGGTGVAHFVGAESTFANPAMLGKSTGREVTGGLVVFRPSVTNDGMSGGALVANSAANTSYIPDISFSSRLDDKLTYGVAMAGIAGMGVDYTGAPKGTHVAAKTALSILKVIPTIAYNKDNYGLGFSPVLQYGLLAISYDTSVAMPGSLAVNAARKASSHTGFGIALGGYYNTSPALTLAASYHSKIRMNYGTQMSVAGAGFGQVFADHLDQPAEIKAGFAYATADNFTVTADYRLIQWGSAAGYKDFGWKDQTVIAVGGKYSADGYWLGAGYNNSSNPISVFANGIAANATNGQNGVGNMFNNMLFPGIINSAYTLGGGYALSKHLELAASFMYAPKVTARVDISDAVPPAGAAPGTLFNTTTHSQQSYSASLRYKF